MRTIKNAVTSLVGFVASVVGIVTNTAAELVDIVPASASLAVAAVVTTIWFPVAFIPALIVLGLVALHNDAHKGDNLVHSAVVTGATIATLVILAGVLSTGWFALAALPVFALAHHTREHAGLR